MSVALFIADPKAQYGVPVAFPCLILGVSGSRFSTCATGDRPVASAAEPNSMQPS